MTNESIEATPRTVRNTLRKAYREVTDFDTELFNALFAALAIRLRLARARHGGRGTGRRRVFERAAHTRRRV